MRHDAGDTPDVMVLGAGINGAALARELLLNGVSVVVVDTDDIASGTTRWSTRLVHGGLRYLEYGELSLVRESLAERGRLCRLAPHLVRPLGFAIPVRGRLGGLWAAAARIVGLESWARRWTGPRGRGSVAVACGLALYDLLATGSGWPGHRMVRVGSPGVPRVDSSRYPLAGLYCDAQMLHPERFTVELLVDARRIAADRGLSFALLTRCQARLAADGGVIVARLGTEGPTAAGEPFRPRALVNATGAWVDRTLDGLLPGGASPGPAAAPLIGGTLGSHLLVDHPPLRAALGERGIYAEAGDGRPVFVLPFGARLVLVGTTDLPFSGDPATARTGDGEIDYLLEAVATIFPDTAPPRDRVTQHYCGVRPLPARRPDGRSPAGITRRHMLVRMEGWPVPTWSIVGGKLTTCRSLAEEAAAVVLAELGIPPSASSRSRPLPGALAPAQLESAQRALSADLCRRGVSEAQATRMVEAASALFGARAGEALGLVRSDGGTTSSIAPPGMVLAGTSLPASAVRFCLEEEWAETLEDLVERRLMLCFEPDLTEQTLLAVAREMVRAGALPEAQAGAEVETQVRMLRDRYGKRLHGGASNEGEKP